jgi:hypothetical protein
MGLIEPANIAAIVVASTSTSNLSNAHLALDFCIDKTVDVLTRNIASQAVLAFKPVNRER